MGQAECCRPETPPPCDDLSQCDAVAVSVHSEESRANNVGTPGGDFQPSGNAVGEGNATAAVKGEDELVPHGEVIVQARVVGVTSNTVGEENAVVAGTVLAEVSWVITVTSPKGESLGKFQVKPDATIKEFKGELVSICGVGESLQTLLHGTDVLDDAIRWIDTPIQHDGKVMLVIEEGLTNTTIAKAVGHWFQGGSQKKKVERKYGHISRWNTAGVTDMCTLFANPGFLPEDDVLLGVWTNLARENVGLEKDDYKRARNVAKVLQDMMVAVFDFNEDLNAWNVGQVTNMDHMFAGAMSFNGDLSSWNVHKVRDMTFMFKFCMFNRDLNAWNVGAVTSMYAMFSHASTFNGDLGAWNVSTVTNMSHMFASTVSFNSDLSAWNVANVANMDHMFQAATSFNGDLNAWNVGAVTSMYAMFNHASKFNGDLSAWNVGNVTDMSFMFSGYDPVFGHSYGPTAFNGDLSAWNVGRVTDMRRMFQGATSFNSDLSAWNVSNVAELFADAAPSSGD